MQYYRCVTHEDCQRHPLAGYTSLCSHIWTCLYHHDLLGVIDYDCVDDPDPDTDTDTDTDTDSDSDSDTNTDPDPDLVLPSSPIIRAQHAPMFQILYWLWSHP